MSILVTPVALSAFVLLIYVARRDQRFLEISPLIFMQLNMIFVWISIGTYFLYIRATQCTIYGYRNYLIESLLTNTTNLIPLNVFLYSWRYLTSLENEGKGNWKHVIRLFKKISLWAVPVTYYALYLGLGITNALSNYCAADSSN